MRACVRARMFAFACLRGCASERATFICSRSALDSCFQLPSTFCAWRNPLDWSFQLASLFTPAGEFAASLASASTRWTSNFLRGLLDFAQMA